MSISRTADTITLSDEQGIVIHKLTGFRDGRVTTGERIYTRTDALELALALTVAATGAVVDGMSDGYYAVTVGNETVTFEHDDAPMTPAGRDNSSAFAVANLLWSLNMDAVRGLAGESKENLVHLFPYLSDNQAREISNFFATLVP